MSEDRFTVHRDEPEELVYEPEPVLGFWTWLDGNGGVAITIVGLVCLVLISIFGQ